MDRSTRRWFAYLVVTPLGLMPLGGCGNSGVEPSAQVESERGIPPLLLPRVTAVRSLDENSAETLPRTTLADHVVSPDAIRRLPPIEGIAGDSSESAMGHDLRVADARPWSSNHDDFKIIPLPPVTESSGPADATPYLASLPQSVMAPRASEPVAASEAESSPDLPELEWPSEENAASSDEPKSDRSALAPIEDVGVEPNLAVEEPAAPAEIAAPVNETPAIVATPEPVYPIRPLPSVIDEVLEESDLVDVPVKAPANQSPTASSPAEKGLSQRSKAMRTISEQAALHVRRGMSLASRNAHYSARSEFIQALRLISQALDVANNSHEYTEALAHGLRALEEADDFVPRGTQLEADLNLEALVRSHRTPVLKDADPQTLRPIFARQKYYEYAQKQLAHCAEGDRSGSMALYGLAKMRASIAQQQSELSSLELPKAMALYQAAMLVDGDNYMASNELGVLLARYGQYDSARSMLEHSVCVQPQAATWHNLAVVYQHLGQSSDVQVARKKQAELAQAQRKGGPTSAGVVWKPVEEFNRSTARTQAPVSQSPAKTAKSNNEKSGDKK